VIRKCDITKDRDWIRVDKFTLKTMYDNVFAIGDVTEIVLGGMVTIPKAGIFAEAQAKVVAQEIIDQITILRLILNLMERAFVLWRWVVTKQDILK